ncbi:MAG TPA: rhomboid family intramembrane serine protease [Saprospiraceae bacterium]|nr:rhomboid family intramembrane serine protease [Saprospiraceae bacterium]
MEITVTIIIILFTALISFQGFNRYEFIDKLKHSPFREAGAKEYYRLLTSGFVHADWTHLLINMFVLYSFGAYIESYIISLFGDPWGKIIFVALYLLNIILANIPTMIQHRNNPGFSSIGASGAVSGIIFIFILLQPWAILSLFFIIPVPAIIAGVGYLIYSSWAANKGHGRLDHSAHFAGAIAGMLMIFILNHQIMGDFIHRVISDFPF